MRLLPALTDDAGARFDPPRTKALLKALKQHKLDDTHTRRTLKSIDALAAVRFHSLGTPARALTSALLITALILVGRYTPDGYAFLFPITLVAAIYTAAAISNRVTRHTHTNDRAATLLSRGICGRCAYPLQGLTPTAPEDLLACPECGAKWHHDRITHPIWEPTQPYKPRTPNTIARLIEFGTTRQLNLGPDHRRRWTHYANSRLSNVPAEHTTSLPANTRKRTTRRIRRYSWPLRLLSAAATLIIPAILIRTLLLIADSQAPSDPTFVISLCIVGALTVAMTAAAVTIYIGDRFIPKRTTAKHILALDRCPSCVHPLTHAQPNTDGTHTCPACKAAWRRTHPEPAEHSTPTP